MKNTHSGYTHTQRKGGPAKQPPGIDLQMDDTRWEISIVCAFSDAEPLLKMKIKKKKAPTFQVFIASQAFSTDSRCRGFPLPESMDRLNNISCGDEEDSIDPAEISPPGRFVQLFSSGRESKRRRAEKFLEIAGGYFLSRIKGVGYGQEGKLIIRIPGATSTRVKEARLKFLTQIFKFLSFFFLP